MEAACLGLEETLGNNPALAPGGERTEWDLMGFSISNIYGSMTHRAQTGGAGASVLPVAHTLSEDTQGFNILKLPAESSIYRVRGQRGFA